MTSQIASHSHSATGRHGGSLARAMAVTLAILWVELVAALASNSLALLADVGHAFADVSGLGLALAAAWLAARPRSSGRTFGLYRLEIVAAAGSAILLLAIAALVLYEAVQRFAAPPTIGSGIVMVAAAIALGGNVVALRFLSTGRHESLTVRGAYLEVAGDLLGSAAVLVAGVVIATTGWLQADAVASGIVALLIVPRTLRLLRDSLDVLLEATPRGVDLADVERHIRESPGVTDVHDLHAWTITSGMNVVSAHVVLAADGRPGDVLDHLGQCLSTDFDIKHSTFQLETPEHVLWEARSAQPQH